MARKSYHLIIKESCGYCKKAIQLLDQMDRTYTLDPMDEEQPKLLLEIQKKWNQDTVPLVWEIDQGGGRTFIGGYSELVQHFLKENKRLFHD